MRTNTIPVFALSLTLAFAACGPADDGGGASERAHPIVPANGTTSERVRPITPVLSEEPPPKFGSYPTVRHGGNYMHNYYLPPSPSSTPWAPAWSPNSRAIAVSMRGSIWEIEVETGRAIQMTHGSSYHSSPAYSADGEWIVYTADHGGERVQLEIVNLLTGETSELTDDEFVYADPAFSPQGNQLAYVSSAPDGFFNVYVREFGDGDWAGPPAIAITEDNDYGANRLYFGSMDMHISPAWLPNNQELLLVSNRDVPLGSGNVLRVPAVAGGIRSAVTVLREQSLYRTRPDVSIDGRRFVYSSTVGAADQFNNLYVQPTDGGEPYKLTFFEHDAFHPRWSPDGEMIAYVTNEDGLPHIEIMETYGGRRQRLEITERWYQFPVGALEVTVRSDDTGSDPVPARVTLRGADGKYYAPDDAYARIGQRGRYPAFHTEGSFAVALPPGEADLTVTRGFETEPQRMKVSIETGDTTRVAVSLRRFADLSDDGWHNGSTHVHMNYGGNLHNSLENLMFMSYAEDQDVVNEQIANKDNRILDHQFFVAGGGAHPVSEPDQLVVVGQEYRPPFYGHVFMFGLRDHLISPFTTGYAGTAIESLYPSNTDMLRKAKEQGAITGYVHPFFGDSDPLDVGLMGGKGFMVDAVLGTADVLEWSSAERAGFFPIYALWNNHIQVCAAGGEDSISNLHATPLLGALRTYVRTPDGRLTADGWFEGLRGGNAFVTNGPLVELTVDGAIPGSTLVLESGQRTVQVEARVESVVPLTRVWLVRDGEDVIDLVLSEDRKTASFSDAVPVRQSGWMHLRAEGSEAETFPLDAEYPQGFTNPVWFIVDGAPVRDAEGAQYGLDWIDELERQARLWPDWRSSDEENHVYAQFEEARLVYQQLLLEATGGG